MRLPLRTLTSLSVILPVLGLSSLANAQDYSSLPQLAPMSKAEVQALPPEYRTAPVMAVVEETVTVENGVETITRTRRIDHPHARPAAPQAAPHAFPAMGYAPSYAPVVFEREQWLAECRRRVDMREDDDDGVIIGGLLGALVGGVAGYEIAGAGDRVLGSVLGVGGGGLIGGLLGSLFDGDDDEDRYDCEGALDSYLSQTAAPAGERVASRTIAYPAPYAYQGYGYPMAYGYSYAPPPQMVLVPVRTEVQQQAVVRETVREERYMVPGAAREIPLPPKPSPKMIKGGR